ncbi:hypothetical protein Pint_09900 [Pistacia integerrima]|uniref:Uncharacterized protein n=1 Tax=Pistacia integerrima TaxID=434235 RepID=A0ACC0XGB2_9ROSI|nr:hypothetical protein Pint_09900 [Pistacia integerrima]
MVRVMLQIPIGKMVQKIYVRNPKREQSRGFHKSQFHHGDNAKRKYGFHNNHTILLQLLTSNM